MVDDCVMNELESCSKAVILLHEEMITDETIDVTVTMIDEAIMIAATTEVTTIEVTMTEEEETDEVVMATMTDEEVMETEVVFETEVVTVIDRHDEISMDGQNDESKGLNLELFVEI